MGYNPYPFRDVIAKVANESISYNIKSKIAPLMVGHERYGA